MIQKIEEPADPKPETAPVVVKESPPTTDDPRYFKLSKPITVGAKTLDRLLVDTSELTGHSYFNLVARFRKECPEEYRTSLNKLTDEVFLSYVVAELNPPMVVEDVRKVTFKDLSVLFLQLVGFLFGARAESATKE